MLRVVFVLRSSWGSPAYRYFSLLLADLTRW